MNNGKSEREKGNKRDKPEHDISFEEQQEILQKNKLVVRSPIKTEAMEDIKKLLTEIKGDMRELKNDVKDMKTDIKQNSEEMKYIREEISTMKEEWAKERGTLMDKLQKSEDRIEKLEKDKIRNNLVITGVEMNINNEEMLRDAVKNMIEKELGVKAKIKRAFKIGQKRCIIELRDWPDKLAILKEKGKLRGTDIFIDSELTRKEGEIQKKIRDAAKEQRIKGANVKIRYQKLEINGKIMKWDPTRQKLVDPGDDTNSKN
jgi:hypothetical protein